MKAKDGWSRRLVSAMLLVGVPMVMGGGPALAQGRHGVDDLRGVWPITLEDLLEQPLELDVVIADVGPDPDDKTGNVFLAAGSLVSPGGARTPLSARATALGDGAYDVSMMGTVVHPAWDWVFVIQLWGRITTGKSGLKDDAMVGQARTAWKESARWSGVHHDRRAPQAPALQGAGPKVYFSRDTYLRREYNGATVVSDETVLEGYTNIVSSGMRVTWPNGTVVDVTGYTDIYSPHVNFVSQFRYVNGYGGAPQTSGPYTFVLLDPLNKPIPGTQGTDVWTACATSPPPQNVQASVAPSNDLVLTWNPVPSAVGFGPANGEGFYQIGIDPSGGQGSGGYGANAITSTSHIVPWAKFGGSASGSPNGHDYGMALSELADGTYRVQVEAFAMAPPGAGHGLEASVWDVDQWVYIEKTSAGVSVITP